MSTDVQPTMVSHHTSATEAESVRDDGHLRLLRALAPTSYIIIPIAARGRILGVLLFATDGSSDRRYNGHDLAVVTELARRISVAVDNATLYRAAEQAAHTREDMVAVSFTICWIRRRSRQDTCN
jgi:GAF domain-containing protein